jgi:DNA ligase-1
MLAATVKDINMLRYPLLASPKLDGVRAIIIDGKVLSRTMKLIPNWHVQKLFGRAEWNGYDGELIVGEPTAEDCYRTTVSAVMTESGAPDASFRVFDNVRNPSACYELRLRTIAKELRWDHEQMNNPHELAIYEGLIVDAGYEGVILRSLAAPYKNNRSTLNEQGMLKLKRFMDDEAVVTGVEELMHNDNVAMTNVQGYTERTSHKANMKPMGMLGALVCAWHGREMRIGTGFTAEERERYWRDKPIGKVAKFKYLPIGMKDLPRHPVFLGWRA